MKRAIVLALVALIVAAPAPSVAKSRHRPAAVRCADADVVAGFALGRSEQRANSVEPRRLIGLGRAWYHTCEGRSYLLGWFFEAGRSGSVLTKAVLDGYANGDRRRAYRLGMLAAQTDA